MSITHVVFDWDGTLLDSAHIMLGADNAVASRFGWHEVDLDYMRTHLTREWRDYYDGLRALNGREPLTDEEVDHLLVEWSHHHDHLMAGAALLPQVQDHLTALRAAGLTLSVCSMQRDAKLQDYVDRFELREFFLVIDGLQTRDDGRLKKGPHLRDHVGSLAGLGAITEPSEAVMIGDSIDDAEAALDIGLSAVLVATGEASAERLRATGVPVAADLGEALALAGVAAPVELSDENP